MNIFPLDPQALEDTSSLLPHPHCSFCNFRSCVFYHVRTVSALEYRTMSSLTSARTSLGQQDTHLICSQTYFSTDERRRGSWRPAAQHIKSLGLLGYHIPYAYTYSSTLSFSAVCIDSKPTRHRSRVKRHLRCLHDRNRKIRVHDH